jgi:hypothetical protein
MTQHSKKFGRLNCVRQAKIKPAKKDKQVQAIQSDIKTTHYSRATRELILLNEIAYGIANAFPEHYLREDIVDVCIDIQTHLNGNDQRIMILDLPDYLKYQASMKVITGMITSTAPCDLRDIVSFLSLVLKDKIKELDKMLVNVRHEMFVLDWHYLSSLFMSFDRELTGRYNPNVGMQFKNILA